jgi:hypothetical protein
MHLCVFYGAQDKQRLYPCTAVNDDWFYNPDELFIAGTNWIFKFLIVAING